MSATPTNYLSVESISKRFGERLIFENLTFGISKGQKVALVAKNGSGKSTLLKILIGEDTADEGQVIFNNDIKVSYLAQDHGLDENLSILENVFASDNDMVRAIRAYEAALERGATGDELQRCYDAMDQSDAWNYEANAKSILGKLNLHDLSRHVATMSGGEKRRIALARVLIEEPDLCFLDEPTNHLDLDMIEWLEQYLEKTSMTLLMVTHDRYFLEVVCDEIIEMENNELYRYKGNFSYYLEKKAEREAMEYANREKAQNLMRRELVWIRTQPKARTTKSKYREEQFGDLKKRATVRLENDEMHLSLNPSRMGGKTVEFHKVKKAFGDKIIMDGFEYNFKRKEAMGIVGNNGSGKTTFLNMLVGKEEPDGGKIVVGDTVVFGYYTQSGQKITAAQLLERFLFPRSMHFNYISKLSGGEKKRLHLLRILMKNPNFLILDEPTNDLDIFTLSVLEQYLQNFPGVLLIVSHDRYFMDKLVEHILVFEGEGKTRDLGGNYTAYRERIQEEERQRKKLEAQKPSNSSAPQEVKTARSQNKMGFKEKFEYDQLTKDIEELEVLKAKKEAELMQPDLDHETMTQISQELGEIISSLDEKSDRWLELAELE
jgi:ATP-binding cassette subfamily F protein uup